MRVFNETQVFKQWWLWAILVITLCVTAIPLFKIGGGFNSYKWNLLGFIPVLLIIVMFIVIKLETRIDRNGITAEFTPFRIFKRHYNWKEINKCYVRKYSAISEYGGWGVRGFGTAKAYNVSGNIGIQIVTKDNHKFLIGTNKPEEARKVIKRYQDNQDKL